MFRYLNDSQIVPILLTKISFLSYFVFELTYDMINYYLNTTNRYPNQRIFICRFAYLFVDSYYTYD